MLHSTEKIVERAFLMGVALNQNDNINVSLTELKRLGETANLEIVGKDFQYIKKVTPAILIGTGKLEELKEKVLETNANLVIFDHELSASQARNLSEELNVKVIDRITLILDIFAARATTNEGKLQVELAQLKYNLPRLSFASENSGKFGGGVGMRGPGETKLELNKRIAQGNILKLQKEIDKIKDTRQVTKKSRQKNSYLVAIVGYTNAGKSTLLNLISKAGIYADDKLFATLETTSRNVFLEYGKKIILTDTVGFINKLPHNLVDAFASTLEEAKDADLILHVIDCSNPHYLEQKTVVENVLKEIGANSKIIDVYNKIDIATETEKFDGICISAKKNIGTMELKAAIVAEMGDKVFY